MVVQAKWTSGPLRVGLCGTSLSGDDSDVVPLLVLAVQLLHRGDEAAVMGDTEQSLRVRLGVNRVPKQEGVREKWINE